MISDRTVPFIFNSFKIPAEFFTYFNKPHAQNPQPQIESTTIPLTLNWTQKPTNSNTHNPTQKHPKKNETHNTQATKAQSQINHYKKELKNTFYIFCRLSFLLLFLETFSLKSYPSHLYFMFPKFCVYTL